MQAGLAFVQVYARTLAASAARSVEAAKTVVASRMLEIGCCCVIPNTHFLLVIEKGGANEQAIDSVLSTSHVRVVLRPMTAVLSVLGANGGRDAVRLFGKI
jgi:hypothetical protein